MTDIKSARILIIATNGFEQQELEVPRDSLREAGAKVDVATPDGKEIMGWDKKDWASKADVDLKISDVRPGDYQALVIPGGVINPDKLRIDEDAMKVVKTFLADGSRSSPPCAMGRGCWCRPTRSRAAARRLTNPSARMSRTPARIGWMRKSSWTTASSQAAIPATSMPLRRRSSKNSVKAVMNAGMRRSSFVSEQSRRWKVFRKNRFGRTS